jgi:hypothetical protein
MNNLQSGNRTSLIYGLLGAGAAFMMYRYYQNKRLHDPRSSAMTSHTYIKINFLKFDKSPIEEPLE